MDKNINIAYKKIECINLKKYIDSFVNKDTYISSIECNELLKDRYYLKLSNIDTRSYINIFIGDNCKNYTIKYCKDGIEDNKRIKYINDTIDLILFCNDFLMFAYF